jgi:hypothetical protein
MNGRMHFKTILRRIRSTFAFSLGTIGLLLPAAPATAADYEAVMPESQRSFFLAYCIACHNADKAEGKVRLDDIPFRISNVETADRWQKVLGALNSGDMPPEGETQPKPEEKLVFLEALSKQMVVARKALADTGGTITLRRLNRREYVNTMRDLLDVEVNPLDMPSDESLGTFDTVGSGLFFSSDQFEQYLKLARAALDDAIVVGPRPPRTTVRIECEEAANKQVRADYERTREGLRKNTEWRRSGKPAKEFGYGDDTDGELTERVLRGSEWKALTYLNDPLTQTGALTPNSPFPQSITIPHTAPAGRYVIRARVAFPKIDDKERRFVEFGTQGDQGYPTELRLLGCFAVDAGPERPEIVEITVQVARTGSRLFAIRERRHNTSDGADKQQFFAKLGVPMDTRQRSQFSAQPKLWIDWMEWERPFTEQWPPRSHRAIFGDVEISEKSGIAAARQVIEAFAKRAFRGGNVRPEFVERLVGHFEERMQTGEPFFEAIKTPLSIVLASPKFLYILEPSEREPGDVQERSPQALVKFPQAKKPTGKSPEQPEPASARVPLTNVELANRLSYFLWAGPPDERLMSYVEAGRLGEPNLLSTGFMNEVDRMLADPRASRFIAGFAHQWLHMTRLDFFQFNPRLYPKFDASLRGSARREVYETIRTVLDEDLPLGTLLKSDFVVVDDLLADYYGLGEMRGNAFRKVRVPEGTPRGGLLGMAAILAMGSDGERSSPVERGAWVLRKLLHDPPPPAPANVPQLSRFGDRLMPARELLLAHQEQAQCAQCHRRIDPIGFAMQNFDAAGQWRDEEYAEFFTFWKSIQKKQLFPIDAAGQLPGGREFTGFYGLRDAVAAHEDDFARGMIEHLIEYALGRPCGFSDAELVDTILKRSKSKGMTLRAVIHALVESREFLSK